jgi:hypothetical protein
MYYMGPILKIDFATYIGDALKGYQKRARILNSGCRRTMPLDHQLSQNRTADVLLNKFQFVQNC